MSLLGLDAFGHPPADAVVAGGFSFVICYVGIPGNPKCVSRAQFAAYVRAGLRVGFVFESTAARATEGFQAGRDDALAVERYLSQTLGISDAPSVFYAVDADVTFAQVEPYFQGVDTVHRGGGYGDFQIVTALLNNNLVTEVWETPAWSRGVIEPRAIVFQRVVTMDVGGVPCDVDVAAGFGQWAYPREDIMTDDDVQKIVNTLLDFQIPREGVDANGQPQQGNTSMRAVIAWFDHAATLPYRSLEPLMAALQAALGDLSKQLGQGTPVTLSDADREAVSSGIRADIGEAFRNAGNSLGKGVQSQ